MKASTASATDWASSKPPLLRFLDRCHADFSAENDGAVADYIPELGKADPAHFGISLATLDGHVYEVGDTKIPFTIQSMSNPRAIPSIRSASMPRTIRSTRWSMPAPSPAPA